MSVSLCKDEWGLLFASIASVRPGSLFVSIGACDIELQMALAEELRKPIHRSLILIDGDERRMSAVAADLAVNDVTNVLAINREPSKAIGLYGDPAIDWLFIDGAHCLSCGLGWAKDWIACLEVGGWLIFRQGSRKNCLLTKEKEPGLRQYRSLCARIGMSMLCQRFEFEASIQRRGGSRGLVAYRRTT